MIVAGNDLQRTDQTGSYAQSREELAIKRQGIAETVVQREAYLDPRVFEASPGDVAIGTKLVIGVDEGTTLISTANPRAQAPITW